MSELSVWAPNAERVELFFDGQRHPMSGGEGGWHSISQPQLGPGGDYGFCLDGGEPLPDPRSAHQPHGVHGLSRLVDHAAFTWSDGGFRAPPLPAAVIYELHVGTFSPAGTFGGVIERLDHLRRIGVTHIELMPVAQFSGPRGWGYDGVDIFAPHHDYGGPDGLKRLVDAAHRMGLAVVLDVVYNHMGPEGSYLRQFGPYFTARYNTPWGDAINLDDRGSDEVRRFIVDNAMMWLDAYHIDALRLDGVHAIVDTSAVHICEELAIAVDALQARLGRPLTLIGESDLNDPRVVRDRSAGGFGLDAQWSDDFHHALHVALTHERSGYYGDFEGLADLTKAITREFVYDGQHSRFRDRRHGRPPVGLGPGQFVHCLQNHDQVGNRPVGNRIGHLVSPGLEKVGSALLLCCPQTPLLFAGQEWSASSPFQYFTSVEDPELARNITAGRRREFAYFGHSADEVPDPQDPQTFERSRLDWSELGDAHHADMLNWHCLLIAMRRRVPDLATRGPLDTEASADAGAGWLLMQRGRLWIACNFSGQPARVPLPPWAGEILLTSSPDGQTRRDGDMLELAPESVAFVGPGDLAPLIRSIEESL
jgi:maltooligosyltrehalose trehalohydrolase